MSNILDRLDPTTPNNYTDFGIGIDNISIPKKCIDCKTKNVCNLVLTFAAMSQLNVIVSIDSCPYYAKE